MKKSWIKTLLIVVMVLLLVCSLVACNPDGNTDTTPGTNPNNPNNKPGNNGGEKEEGNPDVKAYFNRLWELTSAIGGTEIDGEDDIAVELGVQLAINTRNANSLDKIYHQIDLGLDIQAVISGRQLPAEPAAEGDDEEGDETPSTENNTAIKIKIYDPTDADHTEIFALYLLASDLDSLYIDFGGQNIRLPHNLVSTVWNEVLEQEGDLSEQIPGALNIPLYKNLSINQMINAVTGSFGDGWSLNTLLKSITTLLGIDLKDTLQNFKTDKGTINVDELIASWLIDPDSTTVFDKNGELDLKKILTANDLSKMFDYTENTVGGVKTRTVTLSETIFSLASGLIDGMITDKDGASLNLISTLFGNSNNGISLTYTEKDKKIQDFTISALLGGLAQDMEFVNKEGQTVTPKVVPEIAITISDLKIAKATEDNKIDINTEDYKTDIALNEELALEISGVTIKSINTILTGEPEEEPAPEIGESADEEAEEPTEEPVEEETVVDLELNHRIVLGVRGMIDLVNGRTVVLPDTPAVVADEEAEEEPATQPEKNKTQIYIYLKVVDLATGDETYIIEATYADGRLGLQIYDKLAAQITPFLSDILNIELEGVNSVIWDLDLNVADFVHDYVVRIATQIKNMFSPASIAAEPVKANAATWVERIANTVKAALKYISTDNNITIKADDMLEAVCEFAQIFGNTDWTVDSCERNVLEKLTNPPITPGSAEDGTVGELLGGVIAKVMEMFGGNDMAIEDADADQEPVEGGEDVEPEEGPSLMDYVLTILYKIAQHIEIDGVTLPEAAAPEADGDEAEGGNEEAQMTMYEAILHAVLHGKLEIVADAQDGLHLTVKYSVADAYVQITEKLDVVEVEEDTFKDLYAEYENLFAELEDLYAELDALQEADSTPENEERIGEIKVEIEEIQNAIDTWFDIADLFGMNEEEAFEVAGNVFEYGYILQCDNDEILDELEAQYRGIAVSFDTEGHVTLMFDAEPENPTVGTYVQNGKALEVIFGDEDSFEWIVEDKCIILTWYELDQDQNPIEVQVMYFLKDAQEVVDVAGSTYVCTGIGDRDGIDNDTLESLLQGYTGATLEFDTEGNVTLTIDDAQTGTYQQDGAEVVCTIELSSGGTDEMTCIVRAINLSVIVEYTDEAWFELVFVLSEEA